MSGDTDTVAELRRMLDEQRAEQRQQYEDLLARVSERRPMTQADASATMRQGYAEEAERREQERQAESAGDGEDS